MLVTLSRVERYDATRAGRRDAKAAKRFFTRLLLGLQYVPRVIVIDELRSYGAAKREVLPDVEHRQSRYLTDIFDKTFFAVGANLIWHG